MSKKYNYPELERVDTEIGRYYKDSNQNLVPSVTTVLSNTSDKSNGINEWRLRVGDEEADRVIKQSTDIGTSVHCLLYTSPSPRDRTRYRMPSSA